MSGSEVSVFDDNYFGVNQVAEESATLIERLFECPMAQRRCSSGVGGEIGGNVRQGRVVGGSNAGWLHVDSGDERVAHTGLPVTSKNAVNALRR